jgi:nucleotide-binding universal stress UspA family protein
MKKILFLHDPWSSESDTLLSSVVNLASADHSFIKVLLLSTPYFYAHNPYHGETSLSPTGPPFSTLPETPELRETAVQTDRLPLEEGVLESRFKAAGIPFGFSEEMQTQEDILRHSAYADLIVADALLPVEGQSPPNVSLREILAGAHCPVVLLREASMPPDRIILAYDGSYSSIHAIRTFSYLFPHLRYIPSFVVHVAAKEQKEPGDLPYLKAWLPIHFNEATVEVLPGEPAEVLPAFANKFADSAIVVMGAYGRGGLSRMFRQSMANSLLQKANASLFITHER